MLFNSPQYLLFLPIVVGLYWLVDKRLRPLLLVVASYYFYMSWFSQYGLLLLLLTVANYQIGLIVANEQSGSLKKRMAFISGLCINLGCLAFFKYTNFLITSLWDAIGRATHLLGQHAFSGTAPVWQILLPLGISFFVFEFIHYLTDVYQGSKAIEDPVRFGLFAAFFPSQIAGPIKRYQDFDAQVVAAKPFDLQLFQTGCWLILEGMFKKVVLGDNLAVIVQQGFGQPQSLIATDAWLCTIAFALQIYYDFSGYTDIGRGSAMLLGFRLPQNFNKPYFARELIDFWHRWHMSLSTWLRDYLYKPLGGSRHGPWQKSKNLMITMLLGGLWHGASWHYVLWGAFHGIGLAINHAWREVSARFEQETTFARGSFGILAGSILTLFFVLLAWVLFRANTLADALVMYHSMFHWHSLRDGIGPCAQALLNSPVSAGFLVYGTYQLIKYILANNPEWFTKLKQGQQAPILSWQWWLSPPPATQAFAYVAGGIIILGLAASKPNPFIYFQF